MATGCDEEIATDRITDENSDSLSDQVLACHRNSQAIPESMSSAVNYTTNDLGLKDTHCNRSRRLHDNTIATNDICYKDNHPIGSRKVTENIITYHEPIFQSVVNTLYENQKSLNMGKRKVEELDKGDVGSPDSKRTKVESPKIDTGFKVKKKCSIENIIERIRNEKTQSRGGMSTESSSEQLVSQPDLVSNESCVEIGHIASFDRGLTDNIQTASCTKETASIWPNNGPGSYKATVAQLDVKDILASTDSDKALDLSMKTSNQRNRVPSENATTTSVKIFEKVPMKDGLPTLYKVKCQESLIPNLQKGYKNTSDISTVSTNVRAGGREKDLASKKKMVKKLSGSLKKTKVKSNVESLKAAKRNLKHSGVVQSIITHVKKKCVSKSAIETVKGKSSFHKRSENRKCNKSKSVSKKETNSAKNRKKSFADEREQLRAKSTNIKINKSKKQKGSVAVRRAKREASLNAATLVNIFYEKNKSPKLNAKRSKSESDMAFSPKKVLMSSQSFTDIVVKGTSNAFDKMNEYKRTDESRVFKSPKKEPVSPTKFHSSPRKHSLLPLHHINNKDMIGKSKGVKKEPSSPKKQKVSLSDEDFNEIVRTVLQEKTEALKCRKEKTTDQLLTRNANPSSLVKIKEKLDKDSIKVETKHSERKEIVNNSRPIEATTAFVPKSEEEIAEKKRKANLARLKKAKELLIAKELQIAKEVDEESDTDSESDSATDSQVNDSVKMNVTVNETKVRAKKGELCRSARTHVHVEAKTVLENTSVTPKWCECCQSTYYPSQPQQGTKVWRIKQLVDKGTKNPPELIQSASHHFIAAHTSCQVRPYSSPTHVSVLDSSPYVAPLMSHGHVGCTACGCRHTGMLHTAQCQNFALLPCQPYSSTYSVSYPHGHSSCPHCGCGSCCGGGSFHAPGQPLIHQPQIPISTEPPILVHHTVPLHDTPHTVPLQLSHSDSGITSCQVPLQISDSNLQQINHCCQLSQGEIVLRTNSQSDHELIDVGRDDVVKTLKQSSPKTSKPGKSSQLVKSLSKGRKNSASNEIKEGTSSQNTQTNKVVSHQGKEVRKGKTETIKTQIKKQVTSDKDRERKQSNSSKKKRKGSENKVHKSESKSVKGGNSGKTGKGSKNQQSEMKDVEEKKQFSPHGWTWEGEGILKTIINIFDGHPVERKCFPAIRHEDGEIIHVKDCVLVCSGRKEKDIPYVAKVTNFWEDPMTKEMMMTLLWYYRPEHVEGGRRPENQENEVFAAKHRDESLVACIDDRGFVLTYNEYCRFMGEVLRMRHNIPPRKKVVPDPEEPYPSNRIPPVDVDPENVFLCRHVYDLKLRRVLKNPS